MSEELVKRMKRQIEEWSEEENYNDWWQYQRDYAQAADAIDAMTASKSHQVRSLKSRR